MEDAFRPKHLPEDGLQPGRFLPKIVIAPTEPVSTVENSI